MRYRIKSVQAHDMAFPARMQIKRQRIDLESDHALKDWVIFTYKAGELHPDQVQALRRSLLKELGPKTALFPDSIEICVFEEVENDELHPSD